MPENKNQHYVPRVHLNPFTVDQKGAAINLLNVSRLQPINNAGAAGQCSKDYFYGRDDQLDKAIQSIEDPYGPAVRQLADADALNGRAEIILRRFILLQYLRTDAAARAAAERTSAIWEMPGTDLPQPTPQEARLAATLASMHYYAKNMRVVDDLKMVIFRNKTSIPFITSDDPAILTSRLHLQRRKREGRSFGVETAGILFLLPLTPSLLCMLYDGDVYTVDHSGRMKDIVRPDDVHALNAHQYLNCFHNVYFSAWSDREIVAAQAQKLKSARPATRFTMTYAVLDEATADHERYVVRPISDVREQGKVLAHSVTNYPVPPAWPSLLRFRSNPTAWWDGTGAGLKRQGCVARGFSSRLDYVRIRL